MTANKFLDYCKTEARAQAKVSNGRTNFMATGSDRRQALAAIRFFGGDGQHAVLVDVLPILLHEHRRIESAQPQWLSNDNYETVQAKVNERESQVFSELEQDIHDILGPDTLIVYVVDGALRPDAKRDEMSRRARKQGDKIKRQKPLRGCGSKAGEILTVRTSAKSWMTSNDPHTVWLHAHDEADLLIGHVVSAAQVDRAQCPTTPAPDHLLFATPDIQHAITLLEVVDPRRCTIASRDSDLAACNVGQDVGFFLYLEWSGKLEQLTLEVDGNVAPVLQLPSRCSQSSSGGRRHRAGPAPIAGRRPTVPVLGTQPAPGSGAAAAAQPRLTRGGKVAELPSEAGNFILFLARGLDALPALGGNRARRIRTWSICGNDYVRNGVSGITYKVVASGLLDDLLASPFAAATLEAALRHVLGRLASSAKEDQTWRGSSARGRVRKIDRIVVSDILIDGLIESDRLGNCLTARAYISADEKIAPTDNAAPTASHAYVGRPPANGSVPTLFPTNPRRTNPIQPRRPNETGAVPSKARIRPRAPGESAATACKDEVPEIEVTAESLAKQRERAAKEEAARLKRKQDEEAWKARRAAEQKERELEGDDEFELREDGAGPSLPGLDAPYECAMSHAIPTAAMFRDFSATARAAPSAAAASPPAGRPPPTAPTKGRSRHRSGGKQRRVKAKRMTTAPVHGQQGARARRHPSSSSPRRQRPSSSFQQQQQQQRSSSSAPTQQQQQQPSSSSSAPTQQQQQQRSSSSAPTQQQQQQQQPSSSSSVPTQPTSQTRQPPMPPADIASIEGLAPLYWLGVQMSIGHTTAAYTVLTVQRLDRGEAGVELVARAAIKRNGIAREMGTLARYGDPGYDGAGLADNPTYKRELSDAATTARLAGHPRPPAMPMEGYAEAYLPLQTAISQVPERWIEDDLFALGAFVMAAPLANVASALGHVFAKQHQTFSFSDTSTTCLQALAGAPDAASRFTSSMSKIIGGMLKETPFSDRCAEAGKEAKEDHKFAQGERVSSRTATMKVSMATSMARSGIVSSAQQKANQAPATPATAEEAFSDEQQVEMRKAIEEWVKRAGKEDPENPLPADAADSLLDDFREVAFRLLCFRDRNVDLALNISLCDKKSECVGKSMADLLAGRAPLHKEKFAKALLALAITLRRMQNVEECRLLPFFDPDWICVSITTLATLSQPTHLPAFLADLEAETTEAVRQLLPVLQEVDKKGADLFDSIRRLFDLERSDGRSWAWRDAERLGATSGTDDTALAAILGATVKIRPHIRSRIEAVTPVLQAIFQTAAAIGRFVQRNHAKVELLNIVARRDLLPLNFVPTGALQISSSHVRFYGAKVDHAKGEWFAAAEAEALDTGQLFSRLAQKRWSVLALEDYYDKKNPAYEIKHANGTWTSTEIRPLARPGEDEMNKSRPRPAPPTATAATQPVQSGVKMRVQLRLSRASSRKAARAASSPSQLQSKVKEAAPREGTRDGLPVSWGSVSSEKTRERLDKFVRGRKPTEVAYAGFDLGVKNPVAAYVSTPNAAPGLHDGRAEASIVYSRNRLLALRRRNSAAMSHIYENLSRQLDLDRYATRSPSQLPMPVNKLKRSTWVHLLKKAHPIRDRVQVRDKVERRAEISSFVSELGQAIAGGAGRSRAELAAMRWVLFVGDDMSISGQSGATSHGTIMRALPAELRARGITAMFVRTPETCTSQRCPNPRCRDSSDADARRSTAETMVRQDGSRELRLLRCRVCGVIYNRDGAAACNIMTTGLSWWWHGEGLWRGGVFE